MAILEKLSASSMPKRILSLDGGGIRGIFSLSILKKVETLLRENKLGLVLSDYYDIIGGTSTGAIIATGLSLGWEVDKIIQLYQALGSEIFGTGKQLKFLSNQSVIRNFVKENYSSQKLENYLRDSFGEIELGDKEKIKCGLVINTKRADTYSLWTVANHPEGKYYEANSNLKLWELCRASSAAPKYFKPKSLNIRDRKLVEFEAAFIDGGVSLANNPALQLFLVATVPSFGFKWSVGVDAIKIMSIGTGEGSKKENSKDLVEDRAFNWAGKLVNLFHTDALEMNEILLNILGENHGEKKSIDSQFFDLDKINYGNKKLFSFLRYNVKLDAVEINKLSDKFNYTQIQAEKFREMDDHENMIDLFKIGNAYAEQKINSKLI